MPPSTLIADRHSNMLNLLVAALTEEAGPAVATPEAAGPVGGLRKSLMDRCGAAAAVGAAVPARDAPDSA